MKCDDARQVIFDRGRVSRLRLKGCHSDRKITNSHHESARLNQGIFVGKTVSNCSLLLQFELSSMPLSRDARQSDETAHLFQRELLLQGVYGLDLHFSLAVEFPQRILHLQARTRLPTKTRKDQNSNRNRAFSERIYLNRYFRDAIIGYGQMRRSIGF